jgi:type IV pilus assembly protein PilM
MLGFVKNMFGGKTSPIGIDFGSDSLKMAQAVLSGGEWKLQAAASADVPANVRHDQAARLNFFCDSVKDLLIQGNFEGKSVVLALPAASMFIQHLRMPQMDEESLRKALPWEARGKLPIDPHHALLRHSIAGEVFQDQEAKVEVILMAAGRELVNQFLAAAARAKLDVIGMHVEAKAIVDCFCHIYRRKTEAEVTSMYVDIGASGSRAFIARGTQLLFARSIAVGGDAFTRTIAGQLSMNMDEAKLLRLKLANSQPAAGEVQQQRPEAVEPQPERQPTRGMIDDDARDEGQVEQGDDSGGGFALLGAALAAAAGQSTAAPRGGGGGGPGPAAESAAPRQGQRAPQSHPQHGRGIDLQGAGPDAQVRAVERIMQEQAHKIVGELELCKRYYESTFPNRPVDRLIFIGGESKNRSLCTWIAREMGLAAQVGDPLVRMGRVSDIAIESGIDRRQPQPNWAVAIGLSMGSLPGAA